MQPTACSERLQAADPVHVEASVGEVDAVAAVDAAAVDEQGFGSVGRASHPVRTQVTGVV